MAAKSGTQCCNDNAADCDDRINLKNSVRLDRTMGIRTSSPCIILAIFVAFCTILGNQAHEGHDVPTTRSHKKAKVNPAGKCTMCHGIICNEFNFTAWWHRSEFVGDEYGVKLLDDTCNDFHLNQTTVWITSDFGTCGSAIIENKKEIIQSNTAIFTVRNITSNIAREHVYKYNLKCLFARKNNASTGYKLVQGIKKTVDLNAESEFDISIDIYTSSSFKIKTRLPVTISMNQPIYVGIQKIHNNRHFKMIVEQCFATPTASVTGISYVFFLNKCPTDSSFKVMQTDDKDMFSFVITAFRFVEISKAIYMHCRAIMCQTNSKSQQCIQSCSQHRHRRSNDIFENSDVQEIQNITSRKIVFVKKRTCGDLSCPIHSKCINLYPAVCRCDPDYVFSSVKNICTNKRILKVNGLHLNTNWVHTYGDDTSVDFVRFASETEVKLKNTFEKLQISHIEGVKVMKAKQKRGILLDFSILYKQTSTPEDIVETLIKPFANRNSTFLSILEKVNVNTDTIPQIFQGTYAPIPKPKPTARKVDTVRDKVKPTSQRRKITEATQIHSKDVSLSTEKMKYNSTIEKGTVISYFKQRTVVWVLLSISFVAILLIIGLICHYKRSIYYHLMTW